MIKIFKLKFYIIFDTAYIKVYQIYNGIGNIM